VAKPDDVPVAERGDEADHRPDVDEGGTPGTVGALDGNAAVGSVGAVSERKDDEGDTTRGVADPTVGPD
jgi:hypothetical protein